MTRQTDNEIAQTWTVGTGVINTETVTDYGCIAPMARGSDIDSDLRRDDFDGYYDRLEWDVVAEPDDNDARLLIRLREIAESAHSIGQCVDLLEDWPDDTRTPV